MYAHRYQPICQAMRANYLLPGNVFLIWRVSLPCIRTCVVSPALNITFMIMNALKKNWVSGNINKMGEGKAESWIRILCPLIQPGWKRHWCLLMLLWKKKINLATLAYSVMGALIGVTGIKVNHVGFILLYFLWDVTEKASFWFCFS